MNELLPIIAELADAKSHRERAAWLRSCPIDILRRYDMTIRNRLMHAGFHAGIDYLDRIRTFLQSTRDGETGLFRHGAVQALHASGLLLEDEAERLDGPRAVTAPDHSITDL
ncbi:hypothetical protein [Shinella zoogloeoides]|uniref:hypothetical protein n=1 Tax=Shinella zoogloeoides TaxID=352475 RepID=UPI0028B15DD5|nr:hypothetical protein [Shinella zoogloeoides]